MNLSKILSGTFAAAVLTTSVQADVEVIVTGATAFRGAANASILASFGGAANVRYAHSAAAGSLNNANYAIFRGTWPGVSGVTTVRTSWSGSSEGVRDVVTNTPVPVLIPDNLPAGNGENALNNNSTQPPTTISAKFTFSDVYQTSTPFTSPVLNPADARTGVVTFTMLANAGAPAGLTNVTAQQFKALFGRGFQPLSLFTGSAGDTQLVLATGRNDGSGTRTVYLAETGYGIARPVNQFKVTASTASTITEATLWPPNDGNNASTLWGNNIAGNGGYFSGSTLRGEFVKTSASVTIKDETGTAIGAPSPVTFLTWLGTGDAANATGAKVLGYNGVSITPSTSGLNAADKAKVTQGAYTAWSYEHLYYRGTLTTDENTVYTEIKNRIPANLGASGIALTDMTVSRDEEGGPVAP
jgi:hypothetical protein